MYASPALSPSAGYYSKRFNGIARRIIMLLGLQLHRFTLIALLCFIIPVHASGLWQANTLLVDEQNTLFSSPTALLKELLWQAPTHQIGYAGLAFTLPISATQILDVEIFEDAILAPEIAKQYPHLRSFRVHEKNSQRLIGRIDFNTSGLHAIFTHQGQTLFIEPTTEANSYTLYSNSTNSAPFICQTLEPAPAYPLQSTIEYRTQLMAKRFGSQLRVYRLALSADNSYFNRLGNNTYASMVTATSQVNLIFERDLGIRLDIVSDESLIAMSEFTTLSGGLINLLDKNSTWIQQGMPDLQYDIGHVLSAEGGGIATFAGACSNNAKAQGATGFGTLSPNDQRFYIDYLAHELAHQLGASHSFNAASSNTGSACDNNNRYAPSAFEPGSGSTIMSYAGLCKEQNLQFQSDHYFHGHSIEQIRQFVDSNRSCGTYINSMDNYPPIANAGSDYTIPANTPFVLQGYATDADGDSNFTYTWEQMDLGPATVTKADMHKDKGQGPIIRSRPPSHESFRIVPTLDAILQNNLLANDGERLPTTNRQLNFMLTVRSGSNGVDQDTLRLQVHADAGPFAISSGPIGDQTGFSALPLHWQVANTQKAPINCGFVDIALSTDGGQNFEPLLAGVKNNGRAKLVLPNSPTQQARLRVKCSDNIFFAISHPDFTINKQINHKTVISIHAADAERYEGTRGASTFLFIIKRTGDLSQPASVDYTVSGSGENPADENDFSQLQFPAGTLHFASGQDSTTLSIDVQADNIAEPTEYFAVLLSNASAEHPIVIHRAEATIYDGAEPEPMPEKKKRKRGSNTVLFTLLLLLLCLYRQSQPRLTGLQAIKRS